MRRVATVSTLWTPGGEHPVPEPGDATSEAPHIDGPPSEAPAESAASDASTDPETAREMAARMAEAQQQILEAPVEEMVTNHVLGLYELAALHLSVEPPNLEDARLAIDAMGLLVDNLGERLAEHTTLAGALQQLRMTFVQLANDDGDGDHDDS